MSMVNQVRETDNTENTATSMQVQIAGDGEANIDHTTKGTFSSAANINKNGDSFVFSMPSTENDFNIDVTGSGKFSQTAKAEKSLTMNGISMAGGGSLTISGEFNNGMTQKLEVEAEGTTN